MKWFEKEEIKDKSLLSLEELDYLTQPSMSVVGPFNVIFRKHFDYLLAFILLTVAEALLTSSDEIGLLSLIYLFVNCFFQGWILYFFVKHGRRLSWNRCRWKSFGDFKKSERRWCNFAAASIGMIFVYLLKEIPKWDTEMLMGVGIVIAFFALVILLPFFQAWRKGQTHPTACHAQAAAPPPPPVKD